MAASRNWLLVLPPLVFLAFAAVAWLGLRRDAPEELPSALVGQPGPDAGPARRARRQAGPDRRRPRARPASSSSTSSRAGAAPAAPSTRC